MVHNSVCVAYMSVRHTPYGGGVTPKTNFSDRSSHKDSCKVVPNRIEKKISYHIINKKPLSLKLNHIKNVSRDSQNSKPMINENKSSPDEK